MIGDVQDLMNEEARGKADPFENPTCQPSYLELSPSALVVVKELRLLHLEKRIEKLVIKDELPPVRLTKPHFNEVQYTVAVRPCILRGFV